ncbi:hypothetical protein [Ilumatobacter sp.]|uniref:hypothetical protein n=1 Tax=Ilumatobacter sp. TaxID=1967498 RepID=UPI0037515530
MGRRRAGPVAKRRLIAAQLDGSQRRLEGMHRTSAESLAIEQQQQRIELLHAEMAEHDAVHGAPQNNTDGGGLWGTTGPARHGGDLYSSGSER